MSVTNNDFGYGWLVSRDANGKVVACQSIIGFCPGCGQPLVLGASKHDGPSGSRRRGPREWQEMYEVDQREWERVARMRFELRGGYLGTKHSQTVLEAGA